MSLSFAELREQNAARAAAWAPDWTAQEYLIGVVEEVGEVAAIIKRLNRIASNAVTDNSDREALLAELPGEIADVLIYLDLLANAAGIDLGKAVREKFNNTSAKYGFEERL